jgi:uncharacterized protein YuzE
MPGMLSEGSMGLTKHVRERMKERRLETTDIENIIEGGSINKEAESENGTWRYVIETQRMGVCVGFRCDESDEVVGMTIVSAWRRP